MKSNKRVVQRKGQSSWRGKTAETEKKVDAARAMAEAISAKLGQKSQQMEKDSTQLTAEAIMKGTEAQPVTLTVSYISWF